jgi:hypothetical protein
MFDAQSKLCIIRARADSRSRRKETPPYSIMEIVKWRTEQKYN